MKQRISMIIIVLVLTLTVHSAFADASEIELGMTKDEVIAIMGKKGSDAINKEFSTNYDVLAYTNQKVSKFTDAVLLLFFDKGILASKMYSFDETNTYRPENNYGYLLNALTGKYGEPEPEADIQLLKNFYEMFSGKKISTDTAELLIKANYAVIKTWTTDDDITILLVNIISAKADGALTAIQYTPKNITMAELVYNDEGL